MGDLPVPPGPPGIVKREASAGNPLTVALTPEEMWRQAVQSKRGFESSPSGAEDAASRRLATLPKGALDPDRRGPNVGKGYETFGSIQVLDKDGRRVAIAAEWFDGGGPDDHAEARSMRALEKHGIGKVEGGKMLVVVDQEPCAHCAPKLKAWATKVGLNDVEVFVPERESLKSKTGKMVSPKTASVSSFKNIPKAVRLKQLWTYKVPKGPSLPPAPAGNRTARTAIRGALIGIVGAYVLGFAKESMAAEMRAALQDLPRPNIDKRAAAAYFSDPKTGKAIRYLDLMSKELRPFAQDLAVHHAAVVGGAQAELMLIAVSRLSYEERVSFLDDMGGQLTSYLMDLITIQTNLHAAVELESQCIETASAAEALANMVDRAIVADYLLKIGFSFDEIVEIYTNLKSYSAKVRSTFATLRALQTDVKRYVDEIDTLSSGVGKIRWQLFWSSISEEMKRRGIQVE